MFMRYLICLLLLLGVIALAGAADQANYQLGAQDKIQVTVLRHPELSGAYTVPPDGLIDFPRAGQVKVIGKTTAEVTALIVKGLGDILVNPDVSVVLVDPHLRAAYVLGSVAKPGQYTVNRGARITELVAAAGDLIGDREKLTASLVRGKDTIKTDLQQAIKGDPTANLELQEGDVLWVQAPVQMSVVITGLVKTPGLYRMDLGSRLLDLLAKAGDLTGAREEMSASIMRLTTVVPLNLQAALSGKDPAANMPLQDGDLVMIQAPQMITVVISGPVKTPGVLKVKQGSRIRDVVAQAGDLTGPTEKLTASLERNSAALPVKIQAALSGKDPDANIVLQDGDNLVILAPPQINVTVMGQVKTPGTVRLDEGSNLVSAITAAGDLTERPERVKVKLIRAGNVQEVKYGDNTLTMQNGDVVSVEKETMIRVYVSGNGVKNPGAYDLVEGGGPLQVLAQAGGTSDNPSLKHVTIVRAANGETLHVNLADALTTGNNVENPPLHNGDQVIVPPSTSKIVVFGGVNKGGAFPISETEKTTLSQAIGLAGGPVRKAKLNQVVIVRNLDPEKQTATRLKVNFNDVMNGHPEKDVVLSPNDIIYIPDGGLDPDSVPFISGILSVVGRLL